MMSRLKTGLLFLAAIIGIQKFTYSQDLSRLKNAFARNIDSVLKLPLYQNTIVGIDIEPVDGGERIYAKDADTLLIPASAFKVVPSAVALKLLGADTTFATPVATDGKISGNVLTGNLYLIGRGDPMLSTVELEKAVDELLTQGIREIRGDLVYDVSFLDEERNRFGNDARHLYAPPSALTVNYNWINLELKEDPTPSLTTIPQTSYARLKSTLKVSRSQNPGKPVMTLQEEPWGDSYSIRGTVTEWDKKFLYLRLGVSRPGLFAATLFKEACERKGLTVKGTIRKGIAPEGVRSLVVMRSKTVREAVTVMNQESNNVIAETLNKDLGATFGSVPGTRDKGIAVMRGFLNTTVGLADGSFAIGDASGLAMETRFSASQFTTILNAFYRDETIRTALIPSLAWQGHHPHANAVVPPDNIRMVVKSGTLPGPGVNTLVGYIVLEDTKEVFSFAILANRKSRGALTYSGTLTTPIVEAMVQGLVVYLKPTRRP